MAKEKEPPKVRHRSRPELGVGEVNDIVVGKPAVIQVYWPDVEKYGYYLSTDLLREGRDQVMHNGNLDNQEL